MYGVDTGRVPVLLQHELLLLLDFCPSFSLSGGLVLSDLLLV
jgi:hypothetical protein